MAALINALDNYTPKQIGENGHIEYAWSNDIKEKIVQFSFQLVRTSENNELKDIIQDYITPFGGKIIDFPMSDETNKDDNNIYNGAFQYTTSRDRSWIHVDGFNN